MNTPRYSSIPLPQRFVAYYRVSTQKQGDSGLGLEAQQQKVRDYIARLGIDQVAAEFTEVESGSVRARPQLRAAMVETRRIKGTLIVANLSRLSRSVRFLLEIIESGITVRFLDLPNIEPGASGRMMLTVMASVAELERGLVSERTKAALQARKARGHTLGNPANLKPSWDARNAAQLAYVEPLRPTLVSYLKAGMTQREMRDSLNAMSKPAADGQPWTLPKVQRALARLSIRTTNKGGFKKRPPQQQAA